MHNGFLTIDAEKMSKSLGNFVTVHDLLGAGWQGETLRWALLSAHYRAPLDWTADLLAQAQSNLDRMYGALLRSRMSMRKPPFRRRARWVGRRFEYAPAMAEIAALTTAANVATKPADQQKAKAAAGRRRDHGRARRRSRAMVSRRVRRESRRD